MFMPGWSLKWRLVIGLAQAALVVGTLRLCWVETVFDWDGAGNARRIAGGRMYLRGYPVPWEVKRQHYFKSRDGDQLGPIEHLGVYPVAPAALFAIALTLPLALARAMNPELQRDEGESLAPPSRLDRTLQQILCWSVAVLLVSWVLSLVLCNGGTPVPPDRPDIPSVESSE